MGPTAKKVAKELKRRGLVRELTGYAKRPLPRGFDEGLPHDHMQWLEAFARMSAVTFPLLELRALVKAAEELDRLQQMVMPGGPPMSPVTDSYFATWQTLDYGAMQAETLASIACELAPLLGLRKAAGDFTILAKSYSGVYRVESAEDDVARVVDLVTSETREVALADGLTAAPGTLWWTRLLPPKKYGRWSSIATPYVLTSAETDWRAYFERVLEGSTDADRTQRYVEHMKRGPRADYWLDFVIEAYAGESESCVCLQGIPDRPEALPQHRIDDASRVPSFPDDAPTHLRVRARLEARAEETGALDDAIDDCAEVCGSEDAIPRTPQDDLHPLVYAYATLGLLDSEGRTLLDELAEQPDLPTNEREVVESLRAGRFSVFEVLDVELDARIEVRDVLRRRRLWIQERAATHGVTRGDLLAGWVRVADSETSFEGALAHIPAAVAPKMQEALEKTRDEFKAQYPKLPADKRAALLVPHVLTVVAALQGRLERQQKGGLPQDLPPEALEGLRQMLESHFEGWLDTPLAALQGKTPRQAVRTAKGKLQVESLLLEQEEAFAEIPRLEPPIDLRPYWAKLGLTHPTAGRN